MQEWVRKARAEGKPIPPPRLADEGGTTMAWDWTVRPVHQLLFRLRLLLWGVKHRLRPHRPKFNREMAGFRHGAQPFEDPNRDKRG
jgi:hypothetical protein